MLAQLIQTIIGFGLPVLGNALAGPLGGAAAQIIAKALGATSSSISDIAAAIQTTDRDIAIQKLKSAEAEFIAAVQAEATIEVEQLKQVGETIRAEIQAATGMGGRLGQIILFLQLSWRPVMAWQTIVECTAGGILALHELWTGDTSTVDMILKFQSFLIFYFSVKFAVLGVYVAGRSYEKTVDGENPISNLMPSWVKVLLDTLKGKR